jgi:alpha-L-fucosidase 2
MKGIAAVVALVFSSCCCYAQKLHSDLLWYSRPAANWNEALPIGNGFLAAMVFGGISNERIQLNEETIWAGEPGNNIIPNVFEPIQQIRSLLFNDKFVEAQQLSNNTFPRQAPANTNYGMPYQSAGDLIIHFPGHENFSNYHRELDISKAVASVSYQVNGIRYKREYIALLPEQIIAVRITADRANSINCSLSLASLSKEFTSEVKHSKLKLSASTASVDNKTGRLRFQVQVKPLLEGGSLQSKEDKFEISNANVVTLFISIGTNFKRYDDISGNEEQVATDRLQHALQKSFVRLKSAHLSTYRKYFERVSLQLGDNNYNQEPTNERLAAFSKRNDPALAALYFQFGRYLLICSSFPGSQPANLQGKWNEKLNPPWDSKYTVNINTEMNYWPAEVTALPEMHQPLFQMLKELSETGKQSARQMYRARGWNMHHNTDLWRITGPVDGGFYGMWPMGGAWLSQHIWQHFLFTGDRRFLQQMYPVLKGAALFYVDALQVEPSHQWLVVAPSMSPENTYMSGVGISAGTTMDNQLVFDLFSSVIRSVKF